MNRTKRCGILGMIFILLIMPTINVIAVSSWPVQKDDELNYSLSYEYSDNDKILTEKTSAEISVIIKNVDDNLTYDVNCDVDNDVGTWGTNMKKNVEGTNLISTEEALTVFVKIIYEASAFADMESYWVERINFSKNFFWVDTYTFTTYSVDEITGIDYSSSSDAYGYKITASWDDFETLPAGSRSYEIKYSENGILQIYENSYSWVEGIEYEWKIEDADAKFIPSFPLEIFGFCLILGIGVIFSKKR
ncbi:hypothetical protein DSAG12_03964 [Promethearchaeum syntrophicum]|uniref:Uncharacterized protein n=1 Tax=Promethearchaeum syntrophicum TaxID=2594042 RepID=A0A5B9DHC3_9ARCH|nr:hypothetical protein [Candidatus Prometheoarchaeum syntrophicum]